MFKAKRKVVITSLISIIGFLVGALSVSLTWFAKMNSIADLEIGGSVLSQYFDSGDGTQASPFVITRPKHWENLVWLHNNVSNFYQAITDDSQNQSNNKGYYFQVGKLNIPDPEHPEINDGVYYVYDYNADGTIHSNTLSSTTLQLTTANYLIPIGCSTKPFIGELNGNGIEISGFHVLGFEDTNMNGNYDSGEAGFSDVGIFGYIGANSYIHDIYFNNFTVHLANANPLRANDANLHNNGVHDLTGATDEHGNPIGDNTPEIVYAGYIAGHALASSLVRDVYVNNCTIQGGTSAKTGYGYFGAVEDANGALKDTPLEEIEDVLTQGELNRFGGSLNFLDIYGRLSQIYNDSQTTKLESNYTTITQNTTYYYNNETIIVNEETGRTEIFDQSGRTQVGKYPTDNNGSSQSQQVVVGYKYSNQFEDTGGGVFNFASDNNPLNTETNGSYLSDTTNLNSSSNLYMCLFGESTSYPKTVTTYTYTTTRYNCFFIHSGKNYLCNRRSKTLVNIYNDNEEDSEAIAAGWYIDGNNYLHTEIFDEDYFLNINADYSLSFTNVGSTTWHLSGDNEIYSVLDGTNFYLDFDGSSWCVSAQKNRFTISNGNGLYLSSNSNGSDVVPSNSPRQWFFTNEEGDSTAIGCMVNNRPYYLSYDNEDLTLSTTPTTWIKDGSNFYVVIQGIRYYFVYENNNWCVRPESGIKISQNGNNLPGLNNSTEIWHIVPSTNNGKSYIYSIYNGQKYYLTYDNGLGYSLTPCDWTISGNVFYTTIQYDAEHGIDYYLTRDGGTWKIIDLEYYTIHDQTSGNYLFANGTNTFSAVNSSQATHFYFENTPENQNPYGKIYYGYNGTLYFLNINIANGYGTLQSSTSSSSTSWINNGTSIRFEDDNVTYYLEYNDGWGIRTYTDAYYINDGTNYLTLDGTTISNSENKFSATLFVFDASGTIRALGTNYYLVNNNGQLTASTSTSTIWTYDNTSLKTNNKYLVFINDNWILSDSNKILEGYYISYTTGNSTYYMSANLTDGGVVSAVTDRSNATIWSDKEHYIEAENSGLYLDLKYNDTNNTSVYVRSNGYDNKGKEDFVNYENKLYWRNTQYTNSSYFEYIHYNNGFKHSYATSEAAAQSNATALTFTYSYKAHTSGDLHSSFKEQTQNTPKNTIVTKQPVTMPNVNLTSTNYTATKNTNVTASGTNNYANTFNTTLQKCTSQTLTNQQGGNPTYFPLRVEQDKTTHAFADGYAASRYNTGYIISGANCAESGTTTAGSQKKWGDIRISGFTKDSISGSSETMTINMSGETKTFNYGKIYTVNDNGVVRYNETTNLKYLKALEQFENSLNASGNHVFGMHFMDASISKAHTVRAKKVTILGKTYEDYELPEDSVDFHVAERGQISFFAGNYFEGSRNTFSTRNDTFFSLNLIFRDIHNNISEILQIDEIYQDTEKKENAPYVYKFSNGKYTDENGEYNLNNPATSLPKNNSNQTYHSLVFKTSWIMHPPKASSSSTSDSYINTNINRLFYFGIPCNDGEYALGSVSGGTGAYLCYLDIAANGGEIAKEYYQEPENVTTFGVDFRSKTQISVPTSVTVTNPDTNETETIYHHSILQIGAELQDSNADPTKLTIRVVFDNSPNTVNDTEYQNGLYRIYVNNKTGTNLRLHVLLVDDDDDLHNNFPYAYQVIYNNEDTGEENVDRIIMSTKIFSSTEIETNYWKRMAIFNIPSTGAATVVKSSQSNTQN